MPGRVFFKQERVNTCAVATLRSVLASQFDVRLPETVLRYLGDEAHVPILRHGTDTTMLRRMVREASRACNTGQPWRLRCRRRGKVSHLIRELKAGRYPLARVVAPAGDTDLHFVLVVGARPGALQVFDPAPRCRNLRWITVEDFQRWWTEPDGTTWWAVVVGGEPRGEPTDAEA